MNSQIQLFSILQGFTRCYGAFSSHSQEHRDESLFFLISALSSFTCVTQNMGPTALRPIRRKTQWLSDLLKDISFKTGDSNPHSADQERQSFNSVLITAQLRHLHPCIDVYCEVSTFLFSVKKKKIHRQMTRVGLESMTFALLEQMSYHQTTRDGLSSL